jgi:uncharacterized protein with ParB-like and HNH nuclease domain
LKASEINFTKFLAGSKQFTIPIYQRTYSWTQKQCQQLWNDIISIASNEDTSGHFAGSIVYIERGLYHVATVPKLLVIDGQQRLTTLTLLMTALAEAVEASQVHTEISAKKIQNLYLFNPEEEGEDRFRLMLTRSDKETLLCLLEKRPLPQNHSQRLLENLEFFKQEIQATQLTLDQIFDGISKLIVIDVALDRDKDNPQLIFESLNSTGLDLSQADLIRNYVLMGLESKKQQEIYEALWLPMEENFGHETIGLFDRFIRDFLTLKTGKIPNIQQVYVAFKAYLKNNDGSALDDLIAEVYRYSKFFKILASAKTDDKDIRDAISDINALKVDVAYPFLLTVYDDFDKGLLSKDAFVSVLRLVEMYVFRRSICDIPANSLNKTFATISQRIDKDNYLASAQASLLAKTSYTRLPSDAEFRSALTVKDIYSFRSRNYLLRKLENYDRKELVDVAGYTIEHIMPQNPEPTDQWRDILGPGWRDVQKKYLHTIGNLTLTAYNSELSDRAFIQKRDMKGGFADSPVRLNHGLAKLEIWNEEAIVTRGNAIADLATHVWAMPIVDSALVEKYASLDDGNGYTDTESTGNEYAVEDHLDGKPPEIVTMFNILRTAALTIAPDIEEHIVKSYIAYRSPRTWWLTIRIQKTKLLIELPKEASDEQGLASLDKDDNVDFAIKDENDLQYALQMIASLSVA